MMDQETFARLGEELHSKIYAFFDGLDGVDHADKVRLLFAVTNHIIQHSSKGKVCIKAEEVGVLN